MPRSFLFIALLALIPTVAAQETGFDRLDAEIAQLQVPDSVYATPREFAWMLAVGQGRYARADSIAVLARSALETETGLAYESIAWPGAADALALRFLRGDLAALDWIVDDGRWWQPFARDDGDGPYAYEMDAGDWSAEAREEAREGLIRDSSRIVDLLREVGATSEDVAAARIAVARLAARVDRGVRWDGLVEGAEALEDRADAFRRAYPRSRYARFLWREATPRFQRVGAYAFTLGFGGTGASDALAAETSLSFALEMGAGLRERWVHADATFRVATRSARESLVAEGGEIVGGEALSFVFLGASVGPRLDLGPVEVLPYVSGGLLFQNVGAIEEEAETFSTYKPPARPSWGYGLAVEVALPRIDDTGHLALRLAAHRLHPRLSAGFEDLLPGSATGVTLGVTGSIPRWVSTR